MRGIPRFPSSDSISADSSPTSYAPAPVCETISKSNTGTEDSFAEETFGVGIGNRLLHNLEQIAILAPQIDKTKLGTNRKTLAMTVPSITECEDRARKIR